MFRKTCMAGLIAVFVAAFLAASPASADSATVVRPGDNLYRIALKNGVTVADLVRLNGLASADQIYVGQRILIPGENAVASAAPASPASAAAYAAPLAPAAPAANGGQVHIVQAGENLFRIALGYGIGAEAIVRANGLASANVIFAGQALVIPESTATWPRDVAPAAGGAYAATGFSGRSIVIDLGAQRLHAYEGGSLVQSFVISSGKQSTPTPVGEFKIYNRLVSQDMSGPGYYAPGVPWVQYFVGDYAMHGTYWHDSFGLPVSHGCVNMRTPDAQWLFYWAQQGTPVSVRW
jgi:lipoprotein-anchoring transpeptidase ErfK/SrfK